MKLRAVAILQSINARVTCVLEMAGSVEIIGLRKASDLARLDSHVSRAGTKWARGVTKVNFSWNGGL